MSSIAFTLRQAIACELDQRIGFAREYVEQKHAICQAVLSHQVKHVMCDQPPVVEGRECAVMRTCILNTLVVLLTVTCTPYV